MADHIVIEGVKPYDGRYLFDLDNQELTTREWGWIKRLAGYLPANIEDGLTDPELIVVFAAIALHRGGKVDTRDVPEVFDRLADAPFGAAVRFEGEVAAEDESGEGDALPPVPEESSSESRPTSGPGSARSSEQLREHQNGYGTPDSDTSASVRATLET